MKKILLGLILANIAMAAPTAGLKNNDGRIAMVADGMCDSRTFSVKIDGETYVSNSGKTQWDIGNDCSINMQLSRSVFDGRDRVELITYRGFRETHSFKGRVPARLGFRYLPLEEQDGYYHHPSMQFHRNSNAQLVLKGRELCDSETFKIRIIQDTLFGEDRDWYTSHSGKTEWDINNCAINMTLNEEISDQLLFPGTRLEVRTYAASGRKTHTFSYRVRSLLDVTAILAGTVLTIVLED